VFPLADILRDVLDIGQKEMNNGIEIEFAVDLNAPKGKPVVFYLLQIRPIVNSTETIDENLEEIDREKTVIQTTNALVAA